MIDAVDTDMIAWLTDVVDPLPVTLAEPSGGSAVPGVACHLMSLRPDPEPRGNSLPPVRAIARYLITARADEPSAAHRALGQVLVAATDRADIELELDDTPTEVWRAFGVVPQAAVVLRATVRWVRADTPAPLVREPLRVQFQGMTDLFDPPDHERLAAVATASSTTTPSTTPSTTTRITSHKE
jgi:hypothetical protein